MTTPAEAILAGSVIVGVDGSDSALRAVRWAGVRALSLGCPLRLVHATVWPLVRHPAPPSVPGDYRTVMVDQAREWLAQARRVVTRAAPGVPVHDHLIAGEAGPILLELSRTAREVVIGSRGLGGFTGMLVGSTAMALVQHARCPVVILGEPGDPNGPVVVGVAEPPSAERVLEYAFDTASRGKAPLVALHTWSDAGTGVLWGPPSTGLGWDTARQDEQRRLAQWLASWQQKYSDVVVRPVVAQGRPAHQLREAGRDARLLVVGSRGRGGFSGLLLGSTSRALVQDAPCPLAVVRVDAGTGK